jgi:acyl dehydratase
VGVQCRERRRLMAAAAALRPGLELGPSRWVVIDQQRIDGFAATTEDSQWLHTDRERAAAGPFGTTIAHGFLTLSLLPTLWFEVTGDAGRRVTINYGVNRVRFPEPVPTDSRVRARFRVHELSEIDGGQQALVEGTVERDGSQKPVCVAELVFLFLDGLDPKSVPSGSEL